MNINNILKRNHKGLGRLSTMGFGLLLTIIALYGGVTFVGGFAYNGNYVQNQTVYNTYNSIRQDPGAPGGIFAVGGLSNQINTQSTNFTSGNIQPDLINTLTTAGAFFTSFGAIFNLLISFVLAPFGIVGINTAFVGVLFGIMFTFFIFLAILYIWSLTVQ